MDIDELVKIYQDEFDRWGGYRIAKGKRKPFELIRLDDNDNPQVTESFATRNEASIAARTYPVKAAVNAVVSKIKRHNGTLGPEE